MTALASFARPNFDVEAIRADFPILHQQINGHDLVFLDTAASAQKPRQVIQAMVEVMENDYANVHRGVYALSQRATDKFEAARGKAAKFINAPHEDSIILSRGATEGINLVAASYGQRLGPGDEIITTELEHHSNIVPWQIIAEKQGAKVLFAPMDDDGALDMDAFRSLISNRTKIVAVTHVANTMGDGAASAGNRASHPCGWRDYSGGWLPGSTAYAGRCAGPGCRFLCILRP